MLGVEVFRDKQGLGLKQRDEGKEEAEKDAEEEGEAEKDVKLDLENGDKNGSSQPKTDSGNQGASSWEYRDIREKGGLTEDLLEI